MREELPRNLTIRQFRRNLERAGWVLVSKKGHLTYRSPDGQKISLPSSPSDVNWSRNQAKRLAAIDPDLVRRH